MPSYRIAGACLNQTPLDWENNVANIINSIKKARSEKVTILCLPELAISGYGCEDLFLSEWLPKKAISFLPEVAMACEDILVAVGLPVLFEGILYNCVCLIKDQTILGINVKQQLANDGVHYEPRWFTPWIPEEVKEITINGQSYPFGDLIYEYGPFKIGLEICEDAWTGDLRPACRLVKKGVNLILNPSASHFAMTKSKRRELLVKKSSIDFDCTYLYANLLGNESGRMIFDGEVFIFQQGAEIQRNTRLSFENYNVVWADIDPENSANSSAVKNDDTHEKSLEFVKAASLALFDYMRKSRSTGFVLSLSGGADSSTCAVLVAEMVRRGVKELGILDFLKKLHLDATKLKIDITEKDEILLARNITQRILTCAYQGTKNSSQATFDSAKALADDVGALFYSWKIDEEVSSYTSKIEAAIGKSLNWQDHDITLQNIQARSRAPIIWMLANLNNALLMTTSNRSEGDVGYATMDGDTCGSISPIAAVDKHFINQWLRWAEHALGYASLHHVNSLDPSAELRPLDRNQTDEDDLMPYDLLVEIEILAIQKHLSPVDVYRGLSKKLTIERAQLKSYIVKFFKLWSRNQWKRERIAPSFHLDDFNVDPRTWCRFPILSGGFKDELEALADYEG